MGLLLQVIWLLLNLCAIAALAVSGSSGFTVPISPEPSSLISKEARAPSSSLEPALPNGSVFQPPVVSPLVASPSGTIKGLPPSLSLGWFSRPSPHHVLASTPSQQPHDSARPTSSGKTLHDFAPLPGVKPPYATEPPHYSTVTPSATPWLPALEPPEATGPSRDSTATPSSEPPQSASPVLVSEPPQAAALPPSQETRRFFPSPSPIVSKHTSVAPASRDPQEPSPLGFSPAPTTEPLHRSSLPLAAKPPDATPPPPVAEPPGSLTLSPPPKTLPLSNSPPPVDLPNESSSPPLLAPSRSPPDLISPSHASVPPPLMVPFPVNPPLALPSPSPVNISLSPPLARPPSATSTPLPVELPHSFPPPSSTVPGTIPPHVSPPIPLLGPPFDSPPFVMPSNVSAPPAPFVTPSNVSAPPPPFALPSNVSAPSPPFGTPSNFSASPPPPFGTPSNVSASPPPFGTPSNVSASPPPFVTPSNVSAPPPPFGTPSNVSASPPPFVTPSNVSAPPPTVVILPSPRFAPPPSKSKVSQSSMPPLTSPETPVLSPPHAPPPLAMPSNASVAPPLRPLPPSVFPPPPSEASISSTPPPVMQDPVPAAPPRASKKKETQTGAPPPLPGSPETSPSSRISGAQPPVSHQVEAPKHSAHFSSSNGSEPHAPLSPAVAPIVSPRNSGVPVTVPPSRAPNHLSPSVHMPPPNGSFHSPAPPAPKFERENKTAPPPFAFQAHPPRVENHFTPRQSPVKAIAPSIHESRRPSQLSPLPAVPAPKSVNPPSSSIHKHHHPRDKVRSQSPSSAPVPPPLPGSSVAVASSPLPTETSEISPAPSPSPALRSSASHSKIPLLSPKISPSGSSTRNTKRPHAPPIMALPPPPPNQDCGYLKCPEPLTITPPGSPCDCVLPMQVGLRLSVALYTFFPLVAQLAGEIAPGVFLKQSQVRIMGANAATQEPDKTIVLIDLIPLGDKFDNITSNLIFQRFWHKQVFIDKSVFGDYDVLYVRYPGLPPSPPMAPADIAVINGMPYVVGDPNGSKIHPLGVDVPQQKRRHKLNGSLIAVIVISAIVAVFICSSVAWIIVVRHKQRNSQPAQTPRALPSIAGLSGRAGHSAGSGPSSSLSLNSSLAAYTGSAKTFTATEIEKATDNFNPSRTLGEGGFGRVYSGILEDETNIAVKVLKRDDQQGGREFLAEVEMLSRLHHRNLVKLIGICIDENMRCLVYELVPNGSVESHLHGVHREAAPLDWASRLKIALGAARGLAYLHEDSSPRVIHRDFKASNILLENDFTPKVADFGLARTATDEENRHISTRVMGTFGYVAPEYAMTGHLLVKSDVYSYGVVLLELLTGRKPVDMLQPPGQENLVSWTRPLLTTREGLESIMDPSLGPDVSFDSVTKVAAIASMCVQPEVSHRPFMGEVVQALKLVCNECDDSKDEDSRGGSLEDLSLSMEFDGKADVSDPSPTQYPLHGYFLGHDVEKGLPVSEIFSKSARLDRGGSDSFRRHSASGPMRTSRGSNFWQKIRRSSQGSVSEHGFMYRLWAGSH